MPLGGGDSAVSVDLLHFSERKGDVTAPFTLRVQAPARCTSALFFSVEEPDGRAVPMTRDDSGAVEVTVPSFQVFGVIAIVAPNEREFRAAASSLRRSVNRISVAGRSLGADSQVAAVALARGAKLLADALPHSQLSRLSLCCNPLGSAGGEALAAACSKSRLVHLDLPMTLPHELLMDVRASVERTRRGGALVAAMQRLALAKLTSERMSSLSDSAGYLLEVPQDLMEAIGSLAGWPAERVMRRFARSRRQRCELALEKAMRQAASIGATEAACASGNRMAGVVKPELERQWNDHATFLVAV